MNYQYLYFDRLIASILQWMSQKKLSQNKDTTPKRKERRDQLTLLKQVLLILVSGLVASAMAMASKCGQMVHAMKASGKIIELMAMESLFMLMEIYMRATGLMIRRMDMELIFM